MHFWLRKSLAISLMAAFMFFLSACGGGGGNGTTTISGSAGDGPIKDGTVSVTDANGAAVTTTPANPTTGADAKFSFTVPSDTALPLTITVDKGIDTVTGVAQDFPLVTAVTSIPSTGGSVTANANPLSTLAVESAKASAGGLTAKNLDDATKNVLKTVGFGLAPGTDPISTPVTGSNVVNVVKANEAVAEMIRRVKKAGSKTLTDTIKSIGQDLTDGVVDGKAASDAADKTLVSGTTAALILTQQAKVSAELLANNLTITDPKDGTTRTKPGGATKFADQLKNAIDITGNTVTVTEIEKEAPTQEFLDQTKNAITVANKLTGGNNLALSNLLVGVNTLKAGVAPSTTELNDIATLLTKAETDLDSAITAAPKATDTEIADALPATTTTGTASTVSTGSTDFGGSKGSATAAQAKTATESVSVVEPQSTSSATSLGLKAGFSAAASVMRAQAVSALSATSDYSKDLADQAVYVHEQSSEAFNTVNEVLCSIAQTKYDQMVNQGIYKAQIDTSKCASDRGDSSKGGGSSSQNQTSGAKGGSNANFEIWTVHSYQKDAASPTVVSVWIPQEDDFGPGNTVSNTIFARMVITDSVQSKPPYGLFKINFAAYSNNADGTVKAATDSNLFFKGFLNTVEDSATGKVTLEWGMKEGPAASFNGTSISMGELAALAKNADGSGAGLVSFHRGSDKFSESGNFAFAYDANEFLRAKVKADGSIDTTTEKCLNRTKFDTSAWRYGLYYTENPPTGKTAGARVPVNSGFPVTCTKSDGTQEFGYLGYWGFWMPTTIDQCSVSGQTVSGQTVSGWVEKQEFNAGAKTTKATPYLVTQVNGKLTKHVRTTSSLADIKNQRMDYFDGATNPPTQKRVFWDGTAFKYDATLDMSGQQQGPPQWTDKPPAPLDMSTLSGPVLSFWSQALGGNVQINLDPPPANGQTLTNPTCTFNQNVSVPRFDCSGFVPANAEVIIYKESFVRDFSSIGTLSCLADCPDGSSFTPNSSGAINPQNYNTVNSFQQVAPASALYKTYTLSNGILTDNAGGAVTISDTATIDPISQYSFGYWSGPLFTDAEKANLACDFDSNLTCGWQAFSSLGTFYTWETGPNDWNRIYIVQDETGAPVNFDPPIQVKYTYQSTGDAVLDAKYGGATPGTFSLEYGGFGDLWGLPSHCVDDGGNEVNCDTATGFVRWVQEFAIPDGATATFTDTDGTVSTGYILALEKEQRMKAKTTSCTVNYDATLTLPDPSSSTFAWSNPRTTEWPTGYAAMPDPPELAGAPAVVNDVVEITVQ